MSAAALPSLAVADDLRRDRSGGVWRRTWFDRVIGWVLPLTILVAVIPILDLVYWISVRALPSFTSTSLSPNPAVSTSLYAPLLGSLAILLLATAFALLFGFLGGLATAEYLDEGSAAAVRITANVMAGIPAIIVGLFGYIAFVIAFGWGASLAAAGLTLGIFMTPYVFRATDLAFASVPAHLREAAYGSGTSPLQYLLRVAMPIAFPQVLSGVFLAMAIGVGETAPIYLTTSGYNLPPTGLFAKAGALTLYIWEDFQNPLPGLVHIAFQAAFLLLVIVIGLNIVVRIIGARSRRKLEGLFQ